MRKALLLWVSVFALVLGLGSSPAQAAAVGKASGDFSAAGTVVINGKVPLIIRDQVELPQWEFIFFGANPEDVYAGGPLLETPMLREVLSVEQERLVHHHVLAGMRDLGLAKSTKDSRLVRHYHNAAMASFSRAAELTWGTGVQFAASGYFTIEKQSFVPAENEALDALAAELTIGFAMLQKALASGSSELHREAALRFDAAYQHLGSAALRME